MKYFHRSLFLLFSLYNFVAYAELIVNANFKARQELTENFARNLVEKNIVYQGEDWPKFWSVDSKSELRKELSFDGNWTLKDVQDLRFYGNNYRVQLARLVEGTHYRFSVQASGEGTVNVGLLTYAADFKFTGNVPFGTMTLSSDAEVSLQNTIPVLPKNASQFVVYLNFNGSCEFKSASLLAVTEEIIQSEEMIAKFDALSEDEQIKEVLTNRDLEVLAYAAGNAKSPHVRNRACYMLGEMGSEAAAAAKVIAENLENTNEFLRVQAAVALTKLGPSAYPIIRRILLGANKVHRLTVGTAVRGMANGVPEELQKELDWANPPVMLFGDSHLPDGSFEGSTNENLVGWEISFEDGATGHWTIDEDRARTGMQSLKITKTNGLGYIKLRSICPVIVPAGKEVWTLRSYFQCFDTSYNTLLLPRLENESGSLIWDDTGLNGGAGWQSQSLLRNTPEHYWDSRMIMYRQRENEQQLKVVFALYGNPATVWLDDVEFPASPWIAHASGPTYPQPSLSFAEAIEKISARPRSSLEIKRLNGKSTLTLNGEKNAAALYLATNGALGDFQAITADGGVKLPVVRLSLRSNPRYPPFTVEDNSDDKNDFSKFFTIIEQALCQAPDSYVILGLNIAFPDDYIERNPEEAWLNEKGEKAWGTPGHMRGFAEELPGGGRIDHPNIWWPSQYSEKAFAEADEMIREFLLQLKEKPYAHIISGVFISGGHDGQFMIHKRDYSYACLEKWREFLRERYTTDQNLAKNWNQPGATIAGAEILPDKPEDLSEDDNTLFYQPEKHQAFVDFKEFEERQIWKNFERYAKIFKDVFGMDKLAMSWCMGGGWNKNFDYFFASDYLDAFVAQPSYEYRQPGSSGNLNVTAESCSFHGKLSIVELDTRNWMRGVYNELVTQRIGTPTSANHFATVILKEAGRMLAHYQGFWHFDIGQNAYRHPVATEIIKKINDAANWVCSNVESDKFTADVAVVYHQQSQYWNIPWRYSRSNFPSTIINDQIYSMRTSGIAFDSIFLADLMANPEFQKYKVYIFMNTFHLNEKETQFIREKLQRDGKVLVWNYAPGFLSEKGISVDQVSALTGIKTVYNPEPSSPLCEPIAGAALSENLQPNLGLGDVYQRRFSLRKNNSWRMNMPRFWLNDEAASAVARYYDTGQTAVAMKRFPQWTSIYSAQLGGIDAELLHNIVREAGAYTLTDRSGLIVDMNGNFISLHAFKGGTYRLNLPKKSTVYDVMSGKTLAKDTDNFDLQIKAQSSMWLLLK